MDLIKSQIEILDDVELIIKKHLNTPTHSNINNERKKNIVHAIKLINLIYIFLNWIRKFTNLKNIFLQEI